LRDVSPPRRAPFPYTTLFRSPSWGSSAAFLDYDRDGWLDLVIVNYVNYDPNWPCLSRAGGEDYCAPVSFPGTATRLFRNLGGQVDRKSTRLNSSHLGISYAVF